MIEEDFVQEAYTPKSDDKHNIKEKSTIKIEKENIKNKENKGKTDKMVANKNTKKTKNNKRYTKEKSAKNNSEKRKKGKSKDRTNTIITIAAVVAIIVISIGILNINRIFPDKGSPVAIVNGDILTTQDIEKTLKTIPSIYQSFLTEEAILNQTIMNTLLTQEAKKLELEATIEEVDLAIKQAMSTAQLDEKEFKKYLAEQNLTLDDIKELYMLQLSVGNLIQAQVYTKIEITEEEIQTFYKESDMLENITLEEVRDQVETFLMQQKQLDVFNEYVAELTTKAEIIIIGKESSINPPSFTSEEVESYANCAINNGLTKDTIIFIYSDNCPHCINMKPIVSDLESEGYNFRWASSSDNEAKKLLRSCFMDVLGSGVPQFICAKNGESLLGEKPEAILKAFADSCKVAEAIEG